MPSPDARSTGPDRWPPLLLTLRRAARPDRVRVAAYLSVSERSAGWTPYTEFLVLHRAWIASLDRVLAEAGVHAPSPLPDAAAPLDAGTDAAGPGSQGATDLAPPRTRAEALGYLYVLEAFRLGCSVLARRIRGSAEPGAGAGPWGELVTALSAVPPEDHPAAVQAAKEAFAAWERRLAGPLGTLGLGAFSGEAHAA
jgi:heme oxygenase